MSDTSWAERIRDDVRPLKRERQYRVRWSRVAVFGHGHSYHMERMCIAERKVLVLWLFPVWLPTFSDWRHTEAEALRDIEIEKALRGPLPASRYI